MLPIPYEQQMQIANMYIAGLSPEKIADQLKMSVNDVQYILANEKVQKYIQSVMNNEQLQLHFKRLQKASDLLDKLLEKIEDFIYDEKMPVAKRKEQHVKLIKEFLYDKLPDVISKTVQTAIQINLGQNTTQVSAPSNLDEKISKLPANLIVEFWDIVDNMLNNPTLIEDIYNQIHNKDD